MSDTVKGYADPNALLPRPIQRFVDIAEACKPKLLTTDELPLGLVRAVKDVSHPLGWQVEQAGAVEDMKVLEPGESVIVDFGGHRTGFLSFNLQSYKHAAQPPDAPCRLRLIFGEIITDVAEGFEPYSSWMSRSWLPDEVLTVDWLPQRVRISRRHAFRFVKFEIISTSRHYGVRIEDPVAHAVSSCNTDVPPLRLSSNSDTLRSLSEAEKQKLRRIDECALRTLRNCMQTVYEDGPRRDMRLWIGDLRLQALANYHTFKDTALAKRCLYLFAAAPFSDDGRLSANVYEYPQMCSGGQSIVDFSLIYAAALLDYVVFSGDMQTGHDIFPIALRQIEVALQRVGADWLYEEKWLDPEVGGMDGDGGLWHFIDWEPTLDKHVATQSIIIFGAKACLELSRVLKMGPPTLNVRHSARPVSLEEAIAGLSEATLSLYDATQKAFISGPMKQISWASNAWAVIADVLPKDRAAETLAAVYANPATVKALTPYLHHYLVEAFIKAGLDDLAVRHILEYWGSMVDAGAETFWEAWIPETPRASPYDDFHINSFCHAWSCTPALLLRQLGF